MYRSYKELLSLPTFEERFRYLDLRGMVGLATFGYDRYLNQILYQSAEWKRLRNQIIIRDNGCDLGIPGHEIHDRILIHHINPITLIHVENRDECVFDPNNLICTCHDTHNAIHYGDITKTRNIPKSRMKGDTCLW